MEPIQSSNTIDASSLTDNNINELLHVITSKIPDNEKIKQAQLLLKKYSELPQSIEGCIKQIQLKDQPIEIIQLSSIILYKSINKNFENLNDEQKSSIKSTILQIYSSQTDYVLIKSIGYVIYNICKLTLNQNKWDNLLDMIFSPPQNYAKEQEKFFIVNLKTISDLLNYNTDSLRKAKKINVIKNILEMSLGLDNNNMKMIATECLGRVISCLEGGELDMFKSLVHYLFENMKICDEKIIAQIYESLCDSSKEIFRLFDNREIIVNTSLDILKKELIQTNIKPMAAELLNMLAKYNKKLFTKNNCEYLKNYLETAVKLINSDENDEIDLEDTTNPFQIGLQMVNSICKVISFKKIYPLVSSIIKKFIGSEKTIEKQGAIALIGVISEGCSEPMRENIKEYVQGLISIFYNDSNEKIKGQCIISMDYLIQFCSPEVFEYHNIIIPMLYSGLNSNSQETLEKSIMEINYFFSSADQEGEEYLNMSLDNNIKIMEKLIEILNTNKIQNIKEKCMDTLASVIANGQGLKPENLMPILDSLQLMTKSKKLNVNDQKMIRNVINCVGNIIEYFSRINDEDNKRIFTKNNINISNYFTKEKEEYFNEFAFNCIKNNSYDLQIGGLSYFSALALIKKEEFNNILDQIMPNVNDILKDESGIKKENELNSDNDDIDSDNEDHGNGEIYWDADFMDAKSLAIKTLGNFFSCSPKHYFDVYFKETIEHLDYFSTFYCEDVYFEVVEVYEMIMISLNKIKSDINLDLNEFWVTKVFTQYEEFIQKSEDQELVSHCFTSIYKIIQKYGKYIFMDNKTKKENSSLNRIINLTKSMLNNELECQIKNQCVEEDELEHEGDIFDAVKDTCLALSEQLGNDFHPYFSQIFPLLEKNLKIKRSIFDREYAFGIIAEVLRYTKISIKFFIKQLFNHISSNVKKLEENENETLIRNIAYLIGIFFEADPESSKEYLDKALNILNDMQKLAIKDGKDNIIACICRIILGLKLNRNNFKFFDKSIETIMQGIPLNYDMNENLTVFDFCVYVSDFLNLEQIKQYIDKIVSTIHILVIYDIKCQMTKEYCCKIKAFLNKLETNEIVKNLLSDCFNKIFNNDEKNKFFKIMNEIN